MSGEFELFGLDSWRAWFRRSGHEFVPAPGQKCLNCDTELKGEFCYHCGQDADTHHRTIVHLLFEAFEGLFHVDGRLWQTVPALFFAPGRLARDLMEGRVARHVPPFRIFLVSLLVFMFTAEQMTEQQRRNELAHPPAASVAAPKADGDQTITITMTGGPSRAVAGKDPLTGRATTIRSINLMTMSDDDARVLAGVVKEENVRPAWLRDDLYKALSNKDKFLAAMFAWGHRLALLLLPIIGLCLGLLFLKKRKSDGRRFYVYDHMLVAMNLLSFIFLTNALLLVLPDAVRGPAKAVVTVWTLVNFFMTLRGGYGASVGGAIAKTLILWTLTGVAFTLLIVGVLMISLTTG